MPTPKRPKRDADATKERILQSGIAEFCANGYGGARIESVARRADCNIRMIYHYFGDKEHLYIAALERVYGEIRGKEQELNLRELPPLEGMRTLVTFTYDHMAEHHDFVGLAVAENIQQGQYLQKSQRLYEASEPLIEAISDLLERGAQAGSFRNDIDPVQLYISILSLSYLHISNRFTLSVTYKQDLQDPDWLARRREHVLAFVLGFLRPQ